MYLKKWEDLPLYVPLPKFLLGMNIRSLRRRKAGESPAALSAAGRSHLPAVRAGDGVSA